MVRGLLAEFGNDMARDPAAVFGRRKAGLSPPSNAGIKRLIWSTSTAIRLTTAQPHWRIGVASGHSVANEILAQVTQVHINQALADKEAKANQRVCQWHQPINALHDKTRP